MLKYLFVVFFAVTVLRAQVSADQILTADTVLIDGPEVDLLYEDVQSILLTIPDDIRPALVADKRKLRNVMDSTYITKVGAYRAEQKGLQNLPKVKADLKKYRENVLAMAEAEDVIKTLTADISLEQAAKERYLINQDAYKTPESVEASHILIKGADYASAEEALAEAVKVRESIVTGEISFEEAAKKHSSDSGSAEKGGSLGQFGKGQMVKPFEEAAFSLQEPGELGEPVKTRYGYHIIRLDKRYPSEVKPFEQVKAQIIKELEAKQRKEIRENYLVEIRDDPNVELNEPAIDRFLSGPAETGGQKK